MQDASHDLARRARAIIMVISMVALSTAPAAGFKWKTCPSPPMPVYPSTLGAISAPFVQPGRHLKIVLNEKEVATSGAFATSETNQVLIRFESLFGQPIALPPLWIPASTPNSISFVFPDPVQSLGRPLAGPVSIAVLNRGNTVAYIAARDFVGLPPSPDITDFLLGTDPEELIPAALGADGSLWAPTKYHGMGMPMPGCEGNFVKKVSLQVGAMTVEGNLVGRSNPLGSLRSVSGYLGAMVINGFDFYGYLMPQTINLTHIDGTTGVSVCRMNDAEDLILRMRGDVGWTRRNSPFQLVARNSQPLALRLLPPKAVAMGTTIDSFGNPCDAGADATAVRTLRSSSR